MEFKLTMKGEAQLAKILDGVMDRIADDILANSQQRLIENGSVDTGEILVKASIEKNFLHKRVIYSAPHAPYIEYGTDPHWMPTEIRHIKGKSVRVPVLFDWAKRKLALPEKQAINAAWAVYYKIGKYGTEPKPFLKPAVIEVINNWNSKKQ